MYALDHVLTDFAAAFPDKPALKVGNEEWSACEIDHSVGVVAASLQARRIKRGDPVWLLLPTGYAFVVAYMAVSRAGGIVVPINPLVGPIEIDGYASLSAPRLIICDRNDIREEAAEALDRILDLQGQAVRQADLSDLIKSGAEHSTRPTNRVILDHEVGVILFTSGTTGRPKGVALTHQGLLAAASASKDALAFDSETTVASPLPMFHVFGQVVGLLASWTAHASLRSTSRFEPQSFLAECVADATVLIAVPAMLDALTALANRAPALIEGHRFRLVVAGGAPLAEASAQRFEAKFGLMPIVGYGMTESSGVISLPRPGVPSVGCGWPIASVEIDVRPLKVQGDAPEGVGELWIKGPHVITAYLGDASAQSNAFDEQGWFNTGDLGSIAPTGELVLAGRSKDMIIRGGYNVFPAEVEAVLLTHPSVSQAAVVGVPDDALGEEIVAYVVATDGTGAAELMEFARSRLALYKYPRSVKFLSAFPMTPAGKVMRHLLPR